jgi:hypothetical protein
VAAVALLAAPRASAAQAFTDPTGDFRAAYLGAGNPASPALDVVSGAVFLTSDLSTFIMRGTMAGPILPPPDPDAAYVYGVNRGAGVARFAGIGAPGILFDAVVILRPSGPDIVNLCFPPDAACPTPITSAGGSVSFTGNTFTALIPVSLLPSTGFTPANYTFNLWPRIRTTGPAGTEISDFAPDNSNVGIAGVVPEPATLLLVAPALGAMALVRRRRSR